MASAQKPTGARRRTTTRVKKPATIDLKATEVKAEKEAAKPTPKTAKSEVKTDTTEKKFGRDAAKASSKTDEPLKKEAPKASPKPTEKAEKPAAPQTSSSGGGIRSGLIGGILGSLATVTGLGVIGQMDSAPSFPLIGSLYERGGESTDLDALTRRLDALENSGDSNLAPIEDRLAKLEAAPSADLTSVETDVASLKEAVSSISNAVSSGGEASTAEVTALAKIAELEVSIANLSQTGEVDLSPIESKLAEVQASVSALTQSVESNTEGVAALNEQSTTLTDTVASVKQSEKVARSVAVNALGTALENDDPIGLALASVKSLVGETAETERLSALNESGIPTRKALIAQLDAFTKTIQNPEADVTKGSLSDRFWGSMQNLVTFRSSGPLEGDSTVAILSRVKANLEQGDLSGLLSQWEKLPEEVQTSGESFKANVSKRMEAFSIYEKLTGLLADAAG